MRWNLYASLETDCERFQVQEPEGPTKRLRDRIAFIALVYYCMFALLFYMVTDKEHGLSVIAVGGFLLYAVFWQSWWTGETFRNAARSGPWWRLWLVLQPPLALGLSTSLALNPFGSPRLEWYGMIGAGVLGYLAEAWAYNHFSRELYGYKQSAGGRTLFLLTAFTAAALAVVSLTPEASLPGAEDLRRLDAANAVVTAMSTTGDQAVHYEDKVQQIDYFQLGAERLWVYYDGASKALRGAYWEQTEAGEARVFDGARWQGGPAPAGWLTQLPQPLWPGLPLSESYVWQKQVYRAVFTEADLIEQGLAGPQLASYDKIMADYWFDPSGAACFAFSAYGRDEREIPETLYHQLTLESSDTRQVAALFNRQMRILGWPEGGEV